MYRRLRGPNPRRSVKAPPLRYLPPRLAFTRSVFPARLLCTNQPSVYFPPRLHCPHCCNTIARRMRNIRAPTRPPSCMSYTIQYGQWQYRVKANSQVPLWYSHPIPPIGIVQVTPLWPGSWCSACCAPRGIYLALCVGHVDPAVN